jgi:hypothetical protein
MEVLTDVSVNCKSSQGGELIRNFLVSLAEKRNDFSDLADVVGKNQTADENYKYDEDSFSHVGDSHIPKSNSKSYSGCPIYTKNVLIEPTLISNFILIHPVATHVDEGET